MTKDEKLIQLILDQNEKIQSLSRLGNKPTTSTPNRALISSVAAAALLMTLYGLASSDAESEAQAIKASESAPTTTNTYRHPTLYTDFQHMKSPSNDICAGLIMGIENDQYCVAI